MVLWEQNGTSLSIIITLIFAEYFNELYSIDVSTRYATMMQKYIDNPDLVRLYENYWRLYISQLPEEVFAEKFH